MDIWPLAQMESAKFTTLQEMCWTPVRGKILIWIHKSKLYDERWIGRWMLFGWLKNVTWWRKELVPGLNQLEPWHSGSQVTNQLHMKGIDFRHWNFFFSQQWLSHKFCNICIMLDYRINLGEQNLCHTQHTLWTKLSQIITCSHPWFISCAHSTSTTKMRRKLQWKSSLPWKTRTGISKDLVWFGWIFLAYQPL